jgi:hypothetical protein
MQDFGLETTLIFWNYFVFLALEGIHRNRSPYISSWRTYKQPVTFIIFTNLIRSVKELLNFVFTHFWPERLPSVKIGKKLPKCIPIFAFYPYKIGEWMGTKYIYKFEEYRSRKKKSGGVGIFRSGWRGNPGIRSGESAESVTEGCHSSSHCIWHVPLNPIRGFHGASALRLPRKTQTTLSI